LSSHYPNLIIAGAPKCGTSSLFFWLGAHPEVCASKVKETYFLADTITRHNEPLNAIEHGEAAYSQFFKHCSAEPYRLEATPVYLYHERPLRTLAQWQDKPRVIFILRKPGDRLYSHWRFNRYRMKNTRVSFEDYLQRRHIPTAWKRNYLADTEYFRLIKPWLQQLGASQVWVYQMEALTAQPLLFMQDLARRLEIDPEFYNTFDFFHRNQTVAVKHKFLHRWGLKLEPLVPTWLQERIIPLYLKLNADKAPPITAKDKALKREINEQYRSQAALLADHFPNFDMKLWYPPT